MYCQQYTDEWVEDSMLLACLTDSGCTCCSMAAVFSLSSLLDQCTDIDTDAKDAALQPTANAWPPNIRDAVWQDRLTFRQLLKQHTRSLNQQLTQPRLDRLAALQPQALAAAYTFTMHELHVALRARFPFSPAYTHLLHALLTQLLRGGGGGGEVAEGETSAERLFATALWWDDEGEGQELARVDEGYFELVDGGWLERVQETLKGKLLPKRVKRAEKEVVGKVGGHIGSEQSGTMHAFLSDRRLLRVFIFRLGLERLLKDVLDPPGQPASGPASISAH